MKTIKVLSLPSRHPYMSKFNTGAIEFVNPNSDFFSEGKCEVSYLDNHFYPASYSQYHINKLLRSLKFYYIHIAIIFTLQNAVLFTSKRKC